MKNRKKLVFMVMLIFSMTFLESCVKEGLVGPKGEKGDVGPQGLKGDKGDKGKNAETTNIDYFNSEWIDANFTRSGSQWIMVVPAPEITQQVLDKGTVTTYLFIINGSYLYKLPYKGTYKSSNKVKAVVRLGEIEFQSTYNVGARFRYTVSPLID